MLIFNDIKNKIIQKKWKVEDVAAEIGMSKQGLYAALSNESLKLSDFIKITEVIKMNPCEFFGGALTGQIAVGEGRGRDADCEKEVAHLRELLGEKERLIQVLLNK